MANPPISATSGAATQSCCCNSDKARKAIYGTAVTLVALGVIFGALVLIFQHSLIDWGPLNGLIHSLAEHTFVPLAVSGSLLLVLIAAGLIWKKCSDSSSTATQILDSERPTPIKTPIQSNLSKQADKIEISIEVARQGDLATIRSALMNGGISNLSSLLFHAALACHSEMVAELLKAGADPSCSGEPTSAMHVAIKCSDDQKSLQTMEVLLKHSRELASQQFRKSQVSPLSHPKSDTAASGSSLRLNLRYTGSLTPLHIAVRSQSPLEKIQLLLQYGADVNAQDERGDTPLMELVSRANDYLTPNMEVIECLTHAGALVSENSQGETFLSLAEKNHSNWLNTDGVLDRLKRCGIDMNT